MEKIREKIKICLAASLSCSMLLSSLSMAAPADELNEIFEKQQELKTESLLAKTLNLSGLGEAISESGMQVQIQLGITEGTLETLGLPSGVPKDSYGALNLQIDNEQKKWLLEAGIGAGEEAFLDAELYGDVDLLTLRVPQFFSGAAAIGGGSFLEQCEGSVLSEYAGTDLEIPDFDLKFFPEEGDLEILAPVTEIQTEIEKKLQEISADMQVDKEESGSQVKYTAYYAAEDLKEMYYVILDSYLSLFADAGLVADVDMDEVHEELDAMLLQMTALCGDEIAVDFYAQDGLLKKMECELAIDTTELETAGEYATDSYAEDAEIVEEAYNDYEDAEIVEEAYNDYEDAEIVEEVYNDYEYADIVEEAYTSDSIVNLDTSFESRPFVGTMKYEYTFEDPQQPWQAFEIKMQVEEQETGESLTVQIEKKTTDSETTSQTTIDLDVWESGEAIYSDTLFWSWYDSETGDLDADVKFTDPDTETEIVLHLDSVISAMENGFVWTIDTLELQAEGQAAGINAEITVSSDPGEIKTPQNPRMLLEMSEGSLMGLLTEISINAENWLEKMGTLMEEDDIVIENDDYEDIVIEDDDYEDIVIEDGDYEDIVIEDDDYEDIAIEEDSAEESASVSLIGGADGPTSIFVAGKVG